MQVVKRLPEDDDILKILVAFDKATLQSLLFANKTGAIPLHFLLHRELKHLDSAEFNGEAIHNGKEQELPENLLFLLTKTYQAIHIQHGFSSSPDIATLGGESSGNSTDDADGFWDVDSSDDSIGARPDNDSVTAMIAAICCAHRLTNQADLSKLFGIIVNNLRVHNMLDTVDEEGNTLVHWICMCMETQFFLTGDEPLLPFLISMTPEALLVRNNQGKLPLHLAFEHTKEWALIRTILQACPESAGSRTSRQQLTLHKVVSQESGTFKYRFEEIVELWNAYPEAAMIPDPLTNLLPFQLAAVSEDNAKPKKPSRKSLHCKDEEEPTQKLSDDAQQISTIYVLLRGAPEVLRLDTT